jgi:ParB-like nuclease family protein
MLSHHHVAWRYMEGERAFARAKRRRWRRAGSLDVVDQRAMVGRGAMHGVHEIPLASIVGTFEPGRARQFDRAFRPVERTRRRWLSVWVADHLPPISVVKVGEHYALLDGHHRVSVAIARGAETIPAIVS